MKEKMYKIASGQIENPSLTLEVDGQIQEFFGREAKCFAFGFLVGLKSAQVVLTDETEDENIHDR